MSGLLPAFAVLTAIAVVAVLWPVFRRHRTVERGRYEVEVYRDQLLEVERDRERGVVADAEARAARLEIERRLLRAAGATDPATPEASGGRRGVVLAAALLVPILATTLYAVLGSPGLPDQPLAMRQDQQQEENPNRPDVQQMVAGLESRLAETPDDVEGWLMLGRSRAVLGPAPARRPGRASGPWPPPGCLRSPAGARGRRPGCSPGGAATAPVHRDDRPPGSPPNRGRNRYAGRPARSRLVERTAPWLPA